MSYLINNQQKMYEIIFATRNKAYGAYAIRSAYGSTIFKSLLLVAMGFVSIFAAAFYVSQRPQMNHGEGNIQIIDSTVVVEFKADPPQPKKPEVRYEPLRRSSSTESGISTRIDTTAIETQSTGLAMNTSTGTSTDPDPVGPETPTGTTTGTATTTETVIGDPPVLIADTQPEYEGGLKALYQFLSSHLQYPPVAMEMSKEGTAYVRFVVDEYGKVGTLSLMNNLGYGLDEEAMRVVGMIPKFKKPGILNGKPVKVYFQLPIKFRLR